MGLRLFLRDYNLNNTRARHQKEPLRHKGSPQFWFEGYMSGHTLLQARFLRSQKSNQTCLPWLILASPLYDTHRLETSRPVGLLTLSDKQPGLQGPFPPFEAKAIEQSQLAICPDPHTRWKSALKFASLFGNSLYSVGIPGRLLYDSKSMSFSSRLHLYRSTPVTFFLSQRRWKPFLRSKIVKTPVFHVFV